MNYVAHIQETKREESDYPVLFPKFGSSLAGAYDELPLPPESGAVDYEGELAVVIGGAPGGSRVSERLSMSPGSRSPTT